MKSSNHQFISFDYVLKNKKGDVLDSTEDNEPLSYVEDSHQIISGLESRMKDLKVGENKVIHVPASEAYGLREEKLVVQVPITEFPKDPPLELGMQYEIEIDKGEFHPFTVTKIEIEKVTLDGNHLLAGEDLFFDVTLKERRTPTEEELEGVSHDCSEHE